MNLVHRDEALRGGEARAEVTKSGEEAVFDGIMG